MQSVIIHQYVIQMANPFYNHNIFPEICKYMNLRELIKLEQLSKCHKDIIRSYPWDHLMVRLMTNTLDVLKMYKFMKLDLSYTYISNKSVKELKKCHTLNLRGCRKVTDESVKELKNCHTLDLNYTKVTDESVKELKNCHALDLRYTNVTDESVKELKNCHTLNLYGTKVTNESAKELKNCHTLNVGWTTVTVECRKYLQNEGVILTINL